MTLLHTPSNLVLIDATVEDYQILIDGVAPNTEVVLLDAQQDGIAQITAALSTYRDLDSVHLISHATPGELHLGSTRLNLPTLDRYSSLIQQWKNSLKAGADLLIYGCQVAAGQGVAFLQKLADLTGANLAASNTLTGNSVLGGNWNLEYQIGQVRASSPFRHQALAAYPGVLVFANLVYAIVNSNEIHVVDITTGESERIGNLLFPAFALAREATTGRLYYVGGGDNGSVAFFDPVTETNTLLQNTTGVNENFLKLAQDQAGNIYALSQDSTNLYQIAIDPANPDPTIGGQAINLGTITGGTTPFTAGSGDIAFDPTNQFRLFVTVTGAGFYRLYTVDTNPASPTFLQATFIGNTGLSNIGSGSLAFGADGSLYATSQGDLYRIDTNNGVATLVASIAGDAGDTPEINDFASLPTPTPVVDVAVNLADGADTIPPGNPITYTITITNLSGEPLQAAPILSNIPLEITSVTWNGVITGGTFPNPDDQSGLGNTISTEVNLDPGGSVTYTVTGIVSPNIPAGTTLVASTPPIEGIIDPDLTNNQTEFSIAPVTITPNNVAPTAIDGAAGVQPGVAVNLPPITATDTDGTIASFTITTIPPAAQGTLFLGDPATGGTPVTPNQSIFVNQASQLFFQAAPGFTGSTFTFTASDNGGATDATPATVTLQPNQPPDTTPTTANVTPGIPANLPTLTGTDPDGTIASFTIATLPPADQGTLFLGDPATGGTPVTPGQTITPAQANQLFFQPTPTFTGGTFTYAATDNAGGTDPTPATVSLVPVANQPPETTPINTAVTPGTTTALPGLTATDPDGTIASFTLSTLPPPDQGILFLGNPLAGGTPVTAGQVLTPTQATQLFFVPTPNFTGGTFTYAATDNLNATDPTPATVTLTASPNQPPTTNPATVNVTPGTTVALPGLTATDPDGTIASFTIPTLPPPDQGTLFLGNPASGGTPVTPGQVLTPAQAAQLFFQPTPNFTGGTFTFTATDNLNATDPTPAAITLSPAGTTNQPPTANNGTLTTTPISIVNVPGLSASDPDSPLASFTITSVPPITQGGLFLGDPLAGGTLIQPGQVLTPDQIDQVFFAAGPNFTGTTFGFTATDITGLTDPTPATFTLSLGSGGNQPPVAENDTIAIPPGGVTPIPELSATDPDGTVQLITLVTVPTPDQGTLFLGDPNAGGIPLSAGQAITPAQAAQLVFQPGPNFTGTSFSFTATDNNGLVDPTPATITLALDDCQPGIRRRGNARNNRIRGTENADTLRGAAGNDTLRGLECPDLIAGNQGNDRLFGNAARDTLRGGLGRDTLNGGDGSDRLIGGRANDRLQGRAGNDTIRGGLGNDRIGGAPGNDVIDSGRGRDNILGGNGDDFIRGRQDNDVINAGAGDDTVNGGLGFDSIRGRSGDDVIRGGRGRDTLLGGSGSDRINGGLTNDIIRAHAGDDTLRGGNANDRLSGGRNDDVLIGGVGRDTLVGGGGSDRFVYNRVRERQDLIRDFRVNQGDLLDLRGITTRPKFGSDDFFGEYIQLQRVGRGTAVRIDSNGDRTGERIRTLAVLEGVRPNALSADSFIFT